MLREPVGVVGVACPDDNPLLSFVTMVACLVVRSNCVVVVPSENFPLPALELYQVLETSDLPAGVINIISGSRDHISKYLVEHQNIDSMWYHGSAEGSKFIEHASAGNLKRTWVNYGQSRDWKQPIESEELLYHATQCKNVWLPMGTTFAN